MNESIKYLIPVIGVIIGATLQFFFSKKSESKKQRNLLRANAYTDYLKAASEIAFSSSLNDIDSLALMAEAKARVAIYGSNTVIKCIADLERIGPNLNNPKSMKSFILIASAMRKDGKEKDIDLNDISQLLMGSDLGE